MAQETEYRRFIKDWKFECGGPHKGPFFRSGTEIVCAPLRAAALDKRGVVEECRKTSRARSFDDAVAAYFKSPDQSVEQPSAPAAPEPENPDANPAAGGPAPDGDGASVKPAAVDGGKGKKV